VTTLEAPAPQTTLNQARIAIMALFFLHGVIGGSWAAQIPVLKAALGVGPASFSIILFGVACGAVIAMPLTGGLAARFGVWPVLAVTTLLAPVSLLGVTLFGGFWVIAAMALFLGACIGVFDVAMNTIGVLIEKRMGKPIVAAMHGMWSLGMFGGVAAGSYLLVHLSLTAHSGLVLLFGLALSAALLFVRMGGEQSRGGPMLALPSRGAIGVGLLAFLALMVEGAIIDWAAIYLRAEQGMTQAMAGWGLVAFSGAMAAARFVGDALRTRLGSVLLVSASAGLAAICLLIAALSSAPMLAIAAFGLTGFGIGNAAPILFAAGAYVDKKEPARGIGAVTTLGYSCFLVGPPVIGLIAEFGAYWLGFVLLAGLAAVIAALASPLLGPHLGRNLAEEAEARR
jgi:fucose permease